MREALPVRNGPAEAYGIAFRARTDAAHRRRGVGGDGNRRSCIHESRSKPTLVFGVILLVYDRIGGRGEDVDEVLPGKSLPSEPRHHESCHARHVRAGHRSPLKPAVSVVREGGIHGESLLDVSARGGDVHPSAVVGVVCALIVGSYGRHGEHVGLKGRIADNVVVIAGGEEYQTSGHRPRLIAVRVDAGVFVEVVDGFRDACQIAVQRPAAVDQHGAVVGGIDESVFDIRRASGCLRAHQAYSAVRRAVASGHSADSDAVVVDSGDSAAHVHAVA